MLRRLSLPPGPALPAPVYSSGGMDLLRGLDLTFEDASFCHECGELGGKHAGAPGARGRGIQGVHLGGQTFCLRLDDGQASG